MVEQPSGTVTLVFTDIEGSTRLLHDVGEEAYREALGQHRRIVRAACARYGGYEVDYEGDSFFYAFGSAQAAVAAVEEGMRDLAGGPIRLRVGIHTGQPGLDPPKYVGLDVHRAARIMSVGHGGQVLLSATTAALVGASLTPLGEHRLKDFAEPVSLSQLGSQPFPPLKTISNTNLPRPASSFIGREREVAEVVALLRNSARLVTLDGPGGSGKTRLAVEAAAEMVGEFKAGVFWVGLAGLREPSFVLPTIAQALGAKEELARHIEERELLLLLDNFEQVVAASSELADLVEECPNLRVLVTSRELLRVRGEVRYEVLPLEPADAVNLFCARAQLREGPEILELCHRLDALPLALELAASRTSVFSPAQLLERLGDRLDLFRGGRDANSRQQTLRAMIEWSYDLLSKEERQLFARLGVFAGGCTVEAAAQIAGAELDVLQMLVDKSLVRHTDQRFWMLETIREYAAEQMEEAGEAEPLRRSQAQFLLQHARVTGFAHDAVTPERPDLVTAELPNLRAALAWTIEADVDLGVRLVAELEMFWIFFDIFEAQRWTNGLLDATEGRPDTVRALALKLHGGFSWLTGDFDEGYRCYSEALELYQDLGDTWGLALLSPRMAVHLALYGGDPTRARQLCDSSLDEFRRAGFAKGEAEVLQIQGYIENLEGQYEKALELALQAERLSEQVGWTWWRIGNLHAAADSALRLSRLEEATRYVRQAMLLSLELGGRLEIASSLDILARIAAASSDPRTAGVCFGAVMAESDRSHLGQWESSDREETIQRMSAVSGLEFDRAVSEGKALTLTAAAEFALDATLQGQPGTTTRASRRHPSSEGRPLPMF